MKFRNILIPVFACLFSPAVIAQQYSHGPRHVGEEVLEELLVGSKTLLARVASGGCTDKGSFRIDVEKTDGITQRVAHYLLTIRRIRIDECKAIVDVGPLISWDLEKDLGLTGNYTVSVKNMVYVVPPPYELEDWEDSMLSAVRKYMDAENSKSGGGSSR